MILCIYYGDCPFMFKEVNDCEEEYSHKKCPKKLTQADVRELQETNKQLNERIATLLEAQASVPTRDVNGTIEAQQSLIRKLKGDVLTLQKKVSEQDKLLAKVDMTPDGWIEDVGRMMRLSWARSQGVEMDKATNESIESWWKRTKEAMNRDSEECAEALRIHRALDGCNGQPPRRMDGTPIVQTKEQP